VATSLPSMTQWFEWVRDDLRPIPGRFESSLRIVLTVVLALVLMLTLQMPFVSLGLYIIFVLARQSPAVSLRSAVLTVIVATLSVMLELAIVIATDNDPMARVFSVAAITFVAGVLTQASSFAPLAPTLGFLYCTVIALWETQRSADAIVKNSLYLVGVVALVLGCSVLIEYLLASRNPVDQLLQERKTRYRALETMFRAYARGASKAELFAAYLPVARLALAGQRGMQELYNAIVQRNLDPKTLPIGTRVRITLQAELVDVSAAFATANPTSDDPDLRSRCGWIADRCSDLENDSAPGDFSLEAASRFVSLRRIEETLGNLMAMPLKSTDADDKSLIVLPTARVPFFFPGALSARTTLLFGLKISFCATLCYVAYHALDYPGISTAVTTVLVAGLTTTGAMKQKLAHRVAGSLIGGPILGLSAVVFLLPEMDSITPLCVLVAAVAFIAAWVAAGRRFGYVGLQIAFSFFTVALATSKAPSELAPARDRLIGIALALVIMWFVFDQIWPVRTVSIMRQALARVLRGEAQLFKLAGPTIESGILTVRMDALRHSVSATITELRTLHEAVLYEFGKDHEAHKAAGETILRAGLSSGALFLNELAVLERNADRDLRTNPRLLEVRSTLSAHLNDLAESVEKNRPVGSKVAEDLTSREGLLDSREAEYVNTMVSRYQDMASILETLHSESPQPLLRQEDGNG
jgi:multidrug resistance protein MdtO